MHGVHLSNVVGHVALKFIVKETIVKTSDSKGDLCISCRFSWPTCKGMQTKLVFGDGKGNDNVIECPEYVELATQPTTRKVRH